MNTLRTQTDGTYNTHIDNQESLLIIDHGMGFDKNLRCDVLDQIHNQTSHRRTIATEYVVNKQIQKNYPKFNFIFDINAWYKENGINDLQVFDHSPKTHLNKFACSFNNSPHIGRKLLTSAMHYYNFLIPKHAVKVLHCNLTK